MKIHIPLHVSGIWIPYIARNLCETGSIGCGLNIDLYVELLEHYLGKCFIELNNKTVMTDHSRYICSKTGLELGVKIQSPIDLGHGYGVSAASTLLLALTIAIIEKNDHLLTNYAVYAHEAEVLYRTGLGDVISQYYGGLELRLKPGAPGFGVVEKINVKEDPFIIACIIPDSETTPMMLNRVDTITYKYGEDLLRELVKKPSIEDFFEKSQLFTRRVFDYSRVDELLREWRSKLCGYYRKKQALIIWCEREWCVDLLNYLTSHGLKCYKTSINKGGFRIVYST